MIDCHNLLLFFSDGTFLVTDIANNVIVHLRTLLCSFNFSQRDMALLQRNRNGFQRDNTVYFAVAGNKRPSSCSAVHQRARRNSLCYGNATSEERDPFHSCCQRACDTIAITLPIMTPCITSNLVFRILSPWNGGVEGAGRRGAWDEGLQSLGAGAGTPAQAYSLPMILFLSPLRPSHANRGHL